MAYEPTEEFVHGMMREHSDLMEDVAPLLDGRHHGILNMVAASILCASIASISDSAQEAERHVDAVARTVKAKLRDFYAFQTVQ